MKFSLTSFITLGLAAVASAAIVQRADADKSDWKYSVGWDGVTLPADAIGVPDAANATSAAHLQKRTVGGVFICTDLNWGGKCGYAVQPLDTCINLGSDWKAKISSFGPDLCTRCLAYGPRGCSVQSLPADSSLDFLPIWTFNYPGDATGGVHTINPWNDQIGSFLCVNSC